MVEFICAPISVGELTDKFTVVLINLDGNRRN